MPAPSPVPGPFQFTIGRVLWTMVVCAVLAAWVRWLDGPKEVQIPLLILLLIYAAYAVLRLPYVLGDLRGRSASWNRIHEQRADLQRLVEEQKRRSSRKAGQESRDETDSLPPPESGASTTSPP